MLVCDKLVALRQDNNLRKIGHNEGDTLSETNIYEYGNKYVCSGLCLSVGKITWYDFMMP